MTPSSRRHRLPRAERRAPRVPGRRRPRLVVTAALVAFALPIGFALAPPPPPSPAFLLQAYLEAHSQSLKVPDGAVTTVTRDAYSATAGFDSIAAGATNYDWASLVLLIGGWPSTDANVTVLTRWMRQENGPNNWWNRNNPLNNGWGSGGGGGTGTYPSLLVAAQMAAQALHRNPGYGDIVNALATSSSTKLEHAIWASPWSTSHYANGSHWSHAPVPAVKAPSGTW